MNLKNVIISIAIIILTIFVTFYGINTLYPKHESTPCTPNIAPPPSLINNSQQCENLGGKWDSQNGYCDLSYSCRQNYENALKIRSRNVFLISLLLGLGLIAIGAFVFGLESVGFGLMGGGVGTIVYGSGAYWPYTENLVRFIISFIGLGILIWIAYWFNKKFEKKNIEKK